MPGSPRSSRPAPARVATGSENRSPTWLKFRPLIGGRPQTQIRQNPRWLTRPACRPADSGMLPIGMIARADLDSPMSDVDNGATRSMNDSTGGRYMRPTDAEFRAALRGHAGRVERYRQGKMTDEEFRPVRLG